MKKKRIMTLLSVIMLSGLFAGCRAKQEIIYDTAQEIVNDTENSDGEQESKSSTEVIGEEFETNQGENDVKVVNLSEQTNTGICIDYSIDTYQPVQDFGFALFKENMDETNLVLSPVSAYIALTMAGNGAEGNTRQQFYDVLGKDGSMTVLSDSMMNRLPQKTEQITLELYNSAWIDDEFTVKDEWIGEVTSLYDAQAFQTNVSSVEAMNAMNEWVEENTHSLIKQMLEEPLEEETRLVLFNTLYFDGKWQNPFLMETTYEEEFHVSDTQTVQVPMMHQYDERYEFFENDYIKGMVMPYRDSNLAFVAILPQGNADIRDRLTLTADGLSGMIEDREYQTVHVKLPKFEVSFDQVLNDSLINMGLVDAFDGEKADFSGIGTTDSGYPICISMVRQKAVVKVDEEGTEAAAATEVAMAKCTVLLDEPIEMYFDKPFLYLIMDMETEVPLFMGIMDNPVAE